MSEAWLLWTHGLKGPELSILANRGAEAPILMALETARKIADPIKIDEKDEALPLSVLARLYPVPGSAEAKAKKLTALANDPGATPAERESAAAMATRITGGKSDAGSDR